MDDKEKTTSRIRVDHLANERTFLSWMRTSLGIMAFGFVVERFSLFLRQLPYFFGKQAQDHPALNHVGYSSTFGLLLLILGMVIGVGAFLKYKNVEKQIEEDTYQSSLALASILTLSIVIIGTFLVIYLNFI